MKKTFEAVCDFLARDQFLEIANQDMFVFLKPKSFKTLGDMARDADLFADASGGVSYCLASGQPDFKSSGQTRVETPSVKRPKLSCNICGKAHSTHECWYNPDQKATSNVDVAIVKPQYKGDNSKRHSKSCENYDGKIKGVLKGVQSNNNVTEHQVNFCKIKNVQSGKHVAKVKRVHFAEDITCSREYQSKLKSPHSSKEESPHQDKEGACHFPRSRLPTAVGIVNDQEVRVLRDMGCTGVIVKRNLVSENQFIGKECGVTLINDSQQKYPVARINIDFQFLEVLRMHCAFDPAHDLVIGNIEGSKFPDMTHFSSGVFKNKQSRKDRRKNRKVKVADKFIRQNRQELCMRQASDGKLADIRRRVESGSVTKSRSFSSGETKFIRRNGFIYRHFKKNGKVSLQLVIPSILTHSVISLAYESRKMVNYVGRKETISKILDEFYWPGVCREVTQFCRSCAICQRTTHNIKVTSTHCCSVPQRNISSKEAVVSGTRRTESQTERRRSYGSGRRCQIPYYWRTMTETESSSQC